MGAAIQSGMTIRAKILNALKGSDVLCDDCLSEVTGVRPRQAINANCRAMRSDGVTRLMSSCSRCRRMKTVNQLQSIAVVKPPVEPAPNPASPEAAPAGERSWYWEGNVQRRIAAHLRAEGWTVLSEADTAARLRGKDLVARSADGRTLWVTVKGFPERSRNVQARHWFAGALLDLALYADEDPSALLAIGLPSGFRTYEGLMRRSARLRQFLAYRVFWVDERGNVTVEEPPHRS